MHEPRMRRTNKNEIINIFVLYIRIYFFNFCSKYTLHVPFDLLINKPVFSRLLSIVYSYESSVNLSE